jgi:hypothetical protein
MKRIAKHTVGTVIAIVGSMILLAIGLTAVLYLTAIIGLIGE